MLTPAQAIALISCISALHPCAGGGVWVDWVLLHQRRRATADQQLQSRQSQDIHCMIPTISFCEVARYDRAEISSGPTSSCPT